MWIGKPSALKLNPGNLFVPVGLFKSICVTNSLLRRGGDFIHMDNSTCSTTANVYPFIHYRRQAYYSNKPSITGYIKSQGQVMETRYSSSILPALVVTNKVGKTTTTRSCLSLGMITKSGSLVEPPLQKLGFWELMRSLQCRFTLQDGNSHPTRSRIILYAASLTT